MDQINLDISKADKIVCEECGCDTFDSVVMMYKFNKLLTGSSDDLVIKAPVFKCSKCGHINKEFLPNDDKNSGLIQQ